MHRIVWGSGNQVGKRQGATRDRVQNQIGTHDGTTETRRWSARHCRGRCVSQACRTHVSPTVQPPSRGRNTPIPIRPLHESRHGVCGPHGASAHQYGRPCVGAHDSIFRKAMFQGVAWWMERRSSISFASFATVLHSFCGRTIWEVIQGEGG